MIDIYWDSVLSASRQCQRKECGVHSWEASCGQGWKWSTALLTFYQRDPIYIHSWLQQWSAMWASCVPVGGRSRLKRDISYWFMRYYIVCVVTSHSPLWLWAHLGSSESPISSRWPLCQAVGPVAPVVGLSPHQSSQRRSPNFQPPFTSFMGLAGTPIFSYHTKHLYM